MTAPTNRAASQSLWPVLPEPAASRHCEMCCWVWAAGERRLKLLNRACLIHGRYL